MGRGESATFVGAGRLARAELPARLHRAVPVRPADHRRASTSSSARSRYYYAVHAGVVGRQPGRSGFPVRDFTRTFVSLQLEQVAVKDLQPALPRSGRHRPQPVPGRRAADRRGRQADDQQDHAEHRPQHDRQPDLPDPGPALHADDGLRGHRRQRQLPQADASRACGSGGTITHGRASAARAVVEYIKPYGSTTCCRSTSGCSSAASPASAGSTSGRSVRATRGRDVRRDRRQQEPAVQRRSPSSRSSARVRLVLFYDAGQVRDRGRTSRGRTGRRPPAPRSASSCRC